MEDKEARLKSKVLWKENEVGAKQTSPRERIPKSARDYQEGGPRRQIFKAK